MTPFKHLPGDYPFSTIIDTNALYVDKTKYIYNLLSPPKGDYFLSRPRRFGKTLLLSTLKELFSGERKRFEGLWIGRHSDYAFPKHPVIPLSLSMHRSGPKTTGRTIIGKLRSIAQDHDLAIHGSSPGECLGALINALHDRYDSKVAFLVDECDAPVTRRMDDLKAAQANADVLHDFFARLKEDDAMEHLRFTLVTGITRYALTSMDSGPNNLTDISLAPAYAGICGFTVDEFDAAFAGLMKPTLESLKRKGKMARSAGIHDLRAKILEWYDGYNWGGEGGVLNPYSIIKFFETEKFDNHWIQSGRPGHLSALIRANPESFTHLNLEEFSSQELRKSELAELEIGPVLFHSGYLTVDEILKTSKKRSRSKKDKESTYYALRIPNYEVERSYYNECFSLVFKKSNSKTLSLKVSELQQALLDKDAQAVFNILNDHISTVPYYHMPRDESGFHGVVHSLFMGMGFTVASGMPGASGRLDICVGLPGKVYILMAPRYCAGRNKPKLMPMLIPEEEDAVLTALLERTLPIAEVNAVLAKEAIVKLGHAVKHPILDLDLPEVELNRRLAMAFIDSFSDAETNKVLASAARRIIPEAEIVAALNERAPGAYLPPKRRRTSGAIIEAALTKAANQALSDIVTREYRGILALRAKRIIDLGLAIYDNKIKAVFGRDTAPPRPDEPPNRRKKPDVKTPRR